MAMYRYGNANVVQASVTPDQWTNKVYKEACKDGQCRMKTAKSVIAKYSPDKYLLSHTSIIASVDVDLADPKDPKSDYFIKPEFSQFVNNNGDAWTKDVIKNTYKTFIGGHNFLEHNQIESLSKGRIIDAALREIVIGKDRDGKDLSTFYVDILVATDRKHEDLVRRIEAKELTTLSMGTQISFSVCSKCGNRAVDETQACSHVRFFKNNDFYDNNGIKRKIAELCGHSSVEGSNRFIEASWVERPAFTGAVLRSFVEPSEEILAKIEAANKVEAYKVKAGDYLKAAMDKNLIAKDPPPVPEELDDPKDDKKEEDKDAPAEEDTSTTDVPAESTPADDPMPPDAAPDSEIKVFKKDLKRKVLDQVQDEVLKDLKDDDANSEGTDSLDETLIRPASLVMSKAWGTQKTWDRFITQKVAGTLDKKSFDKLRYGVHIAMTNEDLTVLKDYGYNKRDFLAVLSFIDGCYKNPLPLQIKKVIASLGGTQGKKPVECLQNVVSMIKRKVSKEEATKIKAWLRLLDFYS